MLVGDPLQAVNGVCPLLHRARLHCPPNFNIQGPGLGAQCILYSLVADCGHRVGASALQPGLEVLQFGVMFLETVAWGFAVFRSVKAFTRALLCQGCGHLWTWWFLRFKGRGRDVFFTFLSDFPFSACSGLPCFAIPLSLV